MDHPELIKYGHYVGGTGAEYGGGSGPTDSKMSSSDDDDVYTYTAEELECLKDRKWWCFLLSSIFTFLAGLLIVLLWRALSIICCRKEPSPEYSQSDLKTQQPPNLPKPPRQAKEEFEGTFVTDAKDWAGELISGQTTTGRILVSLFLLFIQNRNS